MVVVCGAGKWQDFIIRYFLRSGKELCIIAPENKLSVTPKIFIEEDLRNDIEIVRKLSDFRNSIELVFSDQSDLGIRLVSIINEKLNLRGLRHEQTKWFYNKYYFNKLLDEERPQNNKRSYLVNSEEELREILKKEGRLVLKPSDSQSSKGVTLVNKNSDINTLILEAQNHSINGQVIAESFISGKEYTVEAIVLDGMVDILAVSKKEHLGFGIADVLYYDQEYRDSFEELGEILSKFCQKTRIENSMLHGEFMYNGNSLTMIELACRGGGTNISGIILKSLLGYSPVFKVIERITGKVFEEPISATLGNVGLFFFTFKESDSNTALLSYLTVLENDVRVLEMCIEIDLFVKLPEIKDDRSRHGYIILGSNDKREIESIIKAINGQAGYECVKETFG